MFSTELQITDYVPFLPKKPARFTTPDGKAVFGYMAEYETPGAVSHAAEKVRDAGYTVWDVHTPFPIHGLEAAMGVKRTILPYIVGMGGATGVAIALLGQWWITSQAYQIVVQGKPYEAWQPWVPVTFEIMVLLSAFTTLFGMLMMNGLPRFHHPLFRKERFLASSDDRFFIVIEARDPNFDPMRTKGLLEETGGTHVDLVEDE
ncbi:MAG: DUF3341 domain-containing protein [Phycisphaerales bacterium]|nr:DUF3341 domain-containing protein [Phycisphaerales bacterium]